MICEQRLKPAAPGALCAPSQGSRPEELPSQRRAQPRLLRIISSCKRRASLQEHSPAPRGTPPSLQGDLTQKKKRKDARSLLRRLLRTARGRWVMLRGWACKPAPSSTSTPPPAAPKDGVGLRARLLQPAGITPAYPKSPRRSPRGRLRASVSKLLGPILPSRDRGRGAARPGDAGQLISGLTNVPKRYPALRCSHPKGDR